MEDGIFAIVSDESGLSPDEVGARWMADLEGYDDRCQATVGYGSGSRGPSTEVPLTIEKSNGKYSGTITANASEKDIYRVKKELSQEVRKLNLPKGVTIEKSTAEILP